MKQEEKNDLKVWLGLLGILAVFVFCICAIQIAFWW